MDFLRVQLEGVQFIQPKGRKIAVAGETGSGKTTLLKTIAGLAQPDKGAVYFEGQRVLGPAEKLIPGHPGIAYLSQQFELPQHLRVEQVLEYASVLPEEDAKTLFEVCRISHHLDGPLPAPHDYMLIDKEKLNEYPFPKFINAWLLDPTPAQSLF